MKSLAILLIIAAPVVATQPCHQSFCRVQKVVAVQQVHHGYGHALYSVPYGGYGQQGTFWDDSDKLSLAIETAIDRSLEKRGIGSPLLAQSASVIGCKCGACHQTGSGKADALEAFSFDSTPLTLKQAARAQYGIVFADMATRAKLTESEQQGIVQELTNYLNAGE